MLTFPLSPGVHVDEQEAVSFGIERSATAVPVFVVGPSTAPEQSWWEAVQQPVIVRSFSEYENWVRGRTGLRRQGPAFGTDSYAARPAHRKRTPWPAHWPTLSRVAPVSAKENSDVDWGSPLAPALKAFFDNGGSYCYLCPSDQLAVIADMPDVTLLVQAGQPTSEAAFAMLALCQPGCGIFALLDGPEMTDKFNPQVLDDHLAALSPSECAALYFPWLQADWLLRSEEGRRIRGKAIHPVAPSAVAAGLICLTDRQIGPWKAPANVAVSPGLTPCVRMGDNSQAHYTSVDFGTMSVNMYREFRGRGVQLWGARTLTASGNAWGYIPVRRTFDMVERDLQQLLGASLFEPNNPATWQQLRASAGNYLHGLMQSGAFAGRTEAESYYVEVGVGNTMSQAEVDAGIALMRIGMAVVRPAEFVVLEFGQDWTRADGGQGGVPVPQPQKMLLTDVLLEFSDTPDGVITNMGANLCFSYDGSRLVVAGAVSANPVYAFSCGDNSDWECIFSHHESGYAGRNLCANGSGNIFIVGIQERESSGGSGTIVIHTYNQENTTTVYGYISPKDGQKAGIAVALDEQARYLVFGGANTKSLDGSKLNCGAIYVSTDFLSQNAGNKLLQPQQLMLPAPEAGDFFGSTVSISADGSVIAAAAPGRNGHAGMVVTYQRVDDEWVAESPLVPDEIDGKGKFGTSLSLNMTGNRLAIGCPEAENKRGAVYLYRRDDRNEWKLIEKLTGDAREGEQFGFRVSLSGDGRKLAVSSPEGINEGGIKTGAAWWFDDRLRTYQRLSLPAECDVQAYKFGHAIALTQEGTHLAVGASLVPGTNAQGSATTGRVYFYE